MNTFATIELFQFFKEVKFYTLHLNEEEEPLALQFIRQNRKHRHMPVLRKWISKIGNERGALAHFFRNEAVGGSGASALPPPKDILNQGCVLRWYCLRMRPTTVILFNGGEKTKRKAQDCPNVANHFEQANKLSSLLWQANREEEITFDENDELVFDQNYKLKL